MEDCILNLCSVLSSKMTGVYAANFPDKKKSLDQQLPNVKAHTPKHLVIQRTCARTVEDEHKLMGVVFKLQTK